MSDQVARDQFREGFAIGEALGLFPSVIKSGEHWSGTCRAVLDRARAELAELLASQQRETILREREAALVATFSDADVEWLEEAGRYFAKLPTGGEDAAFWSNFANNQNAIRIAAAIRSLVSTAMGNPIAEQHQPVSTTGEA